MGLPVTYNLRNLVVRRTTTLLTSFAIGLTVAVLLTSLALVEGLRASFAATGSPQHVLVTRKGSLSELTSVISRTSFQEIRAKTGVQAASLELVTGINLGKASTSLRGLTSEGLAMRDQVRIVEGRWFRPGQREVVAGRSVADRYPAARLGSVLEFGKGQWTVVGIMDSDGSATDSEIFADLNQVASDYNRYEGLSSILLRAENPQALINDLTSDRRFNVAAQSERSYYEAQTRSALPLQTLGFLVAAIMAVGSAFAAMNTMFTAVAWRSPEIGTLRVLGFSRAGILGSFLIESLLLSAAGGILGCLLVLPLNQVSTAIGSVTTFSEIVFRFRVTPMHMGIGILFSLLVGVLGGFFPARAAARKQILDALRS